MDPTNKEGVNLLGACPIVNPAIQVDAMPP
jgi:hypothetical protein